MKNKPSLVILSGAGISAESGLKTFRDHNGLWNNHAIEEVATSQAFHKNPELVLQFYNERRAQLQKATPNRAHVSLVALEAYFDVTIITQNVDDLHERAGSSHVIHLHGELTKARSVTNELEIISIGYAPISLGQLSPSGDVLRPHIVWFGEEVPLISEAAKICQTAQIVMVVGTSLNVYPAAGLIYECAENCAIYYIDPKASEGSVPSGVALMNEKATVGVPQLVQQLISKYST